TAQAPSPRREVGHRAGYAGSSPMADDQLASRHQRAPLSALRRCPCSGCRRSTPAHPRYGRTASTRRGGLGDRRAPLDCRAQILSLQPSRRHAAQAACRCDQGTLDMRTGPSTNEGGTGPRPLRGALMGGSAPARADDDNPPLLPTPPPPKKSKRKKKNPPPPRHNQASPQSGTPSFQPSHSPHLPGAPTAADPYQLKICQSSAREWTHKCVAKRG